MSDPIRAALERLLSAVDVYDATGMDVLEDAIAEARAALAAQQGERPSERDVAELFHRHMGEGSEVGFENAIAEALSRWGHPTPKPPAEGEVAELVAMLTRKAHWDRIEAKAPIFAEHADRIARAAELLQQQHPAPVPVSERLPEPGEMDGSLVWCGSQAAGLPYWEWCLDDIRHPCSSGYTHWLPANAPALPTALPLPQGEVEQ